VASRRHAQREKVLFFIDESLIPFLHRSRFALMRASATSLSRGDRSGMYPGCSTPVLYSSS
jgi:hypothetical protein